MTTTGTIVAAFGRQYEIALEDGRRIEGFPKGKKSPFACGDHVTLQMSSEAQAQILSHEPRRSLLYRSDEYRQKLIAANASHLILVVATEPGFSAELLDRALVAAEHDELQVTIVLNKCDLTARIDQARQALARYRQLDYPVVELCARQDADALHPYLAGHLSVLVGQSGMGKSTLINALIPGAAAATREISTALDSGKHTTTHARLYAIDATSGLIDSPGLQEFGLAHLSRDEIAWGFREFRPYLGQCRFRDCRHHAEPDCALKAAVSAGAIDAQRLAHFHRICAHHA